MNIEFIIALCIAFITGVFYDRISKFWLMCIAYACGVLIAM